MSDFILALAVILMFAFVFFFFEKSKLFSWRKSESN